MRNLHRTTAGTGPDYTIASQESLLTTATSITRTLTVLLAGIAGIALIVGGIGVMNIMLVSVTERVREIGLRKALGAPPRIIRRQFLVESSLLGLLGGLAGTTLGLLGAWLLPRVLGRRSSRRHLPPSSRSRSPSRSASCPACIPRPVRHGSPRSTAAVDGLTIDATHLARDVICLGVSGDVDLASSAALHNAIRQALTAPGANRVLVDLSLVTFLDSSGINTLVQDHQGAADQNINLQIVNPSRMALRVLDLTGVRALLTGHA